MELEFEITNQAIERTDNEKLVVNESANYVDCSFTFKTSEWQNISKYALFKNEKDKAFCVELGTGCSNSVKLPYEVLQGDFFRVTVFGLGDGYRITTTQITVMTDRSGFTAEIYEPEGYDGDIFSQLIEMIGNCLIDVKVVGNHLDFYKGSTVYFSLPLGVSTIGGVAWTDLLGVPESFPPESHTHEVTDVVDFPSIPSDVSELSDLSHTQFTPRQHSHGNISNTGKIGTVSGLPVYTGSGGVLDTGNTGVAYGIVDDTSTSTVFTATVDGVKSLTDGTAVMLKNGVVTSAAGFTINVNGLGAKPVYSNMAAATQDSTIFNINYTMLFIYDSTRVADGCWICYRGYNSDNNTIAYLFRKNYLSPTATDKFYRYRLLLEQSDDVYVPVNTSTSTNATAKRNTTMNTKEFKIGGKILYYSTSAAVNANTRIGPSYLWQQYNLTLGYSFNNTGSALTLTYPAPVYMVAEPSATNPGMAKLASPYYTQTLPNTADGKLYIFLGHSYSATAIELALEHPIYEYYNGELRLYRDTTELPVTITYTDDSTEQVNLVVRR